MDKFDSKNRRILVIDDNEAIHEDFRSILSGKEEDTSALNQAKAAIFGGDDDDKDPGIEMETFEIESAFQGQEGLEKVRESIRDNRPYAMAFVDIRMPPGWDGIETIHRIWQEYPELQVVICTAHSDYSWQETVRKLGQTERLLILKKPFDNIEVRQIACALTEKWYLLNDLGRLVEQRTEQIMSTRDVAVFALANLAESRDPETGAHLERIRSYCQILAEELRENSEYSDQITDEFIEDLYRSSPLHDIGKVGIPDLILLKPGSLTESEFKIMEQHTNIGGDALKKAGRLASGGFLDMGCEIARSHHERFDGSGYPDKLAGLDIPLAARIAALADVYDALTSVRVYKSAFRPEVAKLMIEEERGKHFDPAVVDAFLNRYEDFIKVRKLHDNPETSLINAIADGSSD
ncbi:MAG: HD domain-containing protein [Sedimentisphaerales bacterium]|nr:HD domain-containing protein [Sedimentisphaerales bacterium]